MYKGRLQVLSNGIFSLSGNSSTVSSSVRAPLFFLVSNIRQCPYSWRQLGEFGLFVFLAKCLLMDSIRAFLMRLLNGPGILRIVFAVPF